MPRRAERGLVCLPSAFPAKAGTQTLSHSLDVTLYRVIARRVAPKQPRGSSLPVRASPLGCFAALAMTRGWGRGYPLTQPSPPRGRGLEPKSPLPEGEGWVRAFFSSTPPTRLPREGGGPDPFAQTGVGPLLRHCEAHRAEATQGIINTGPRQSPGLLRCARSDARMGRRM